MRNITLSDGQETIVLRSDPEFSFQPVLIGERAVMASGKTVMDVSGVKRTAEIPVGWLSPDDLARLERMILKGAPLTVCYPAPDGDRRDECFADMPVFRAFRYGPDGVTQWYGVTLRLEQAGTDPA